MIAHVPPRPPAQVLEIARALAARFAERADRHDREGSFPHENVADLQAAALPRVPVPIELGGDGLRLLDCVLVIEQLAQGDASTALGAAMHFHVIGSLAERRTWDERVFAEVCDRIVHEGALINSAASEAEMGSPSRGGLPSTQARRVPGGYVLSGRKRWVTFAPALRFLLVTAQIEDAIGVFLVEAGAPGLTLVDTWSDSLSLRASGSFDVVLDDVFVPEPVVCGGARTHSATWDHSAFGLACLCLRRGVSRRWRCSAALHGALLRRAHPGSARQAHCRAAARAAQSRSNVCDVVRCACSVARSGSTLG